ncbi:hypothetical protein Tco_0706029 [Tanacetum coccineum]|uniref:Retroviral polymerase SH3-like domain-containing protein n=1 Tax=Tanacetum coccineum TaxID=301880 RepID=A0ABQ4Y8A6_9ASTR
MSNPTSKPSDASPVKIEAPKELPKVSLVNESLKKLKFHLAWFDNVVKIRTTPDAHIEGQWGFKHTKVVFNNEIIPFLKSLKDVFNVFDRDLLNEIMEVQTVFDQMDAAVQQSPVDKKCLEIAKKELLLENDRLLQQIMSQDRPYELMQDMKPDLSFFHVFGALCYPTNDNDDLGKLDAKANIGLFVGYVPPKKEFIIYNKRTRKIIETIHVTFDELTTMASEQFSSGLGLHSLTPATSSSGLVPNIVS